MDVRSLYDVAQGQPNEHLLHMLDGINGQLDDQTTQFEKAFNYMDSVVYSIYETERSPTAIVQTLPNQQKSFTMNGPTALLVDKHSAFGGRPHERGKHGFHFPFNRNHFQLVKFRLADTDYNTIRLRLGEFVENGPGVIADRHKSAAKCCESYFRRCFVQI